MPTWPNLYWIRNLLGPLHILLMSPVTLLLPRQQAVGGGKLTEPQLSLSDTLSSLPARVPLSPAGILPAGVCSSILSWANLRRQGSWKVTWEPTNKYLLFHTWSVFHTASQKASRESECQLSTGVPILTMNPWIYLFPSMAFFPGPQNFFLMSSLKMKSLQTCLIYYMKLVKD